MRRIPRIGALVLLAGMLAGPASAGLASASLGPGCGGFTFAAGGGFAVQRGGDLGQWQAAGVAGDFRTFSLDTNLAPNHRAYFAEAVTVDDVIRDPRGPNPLQPLTRAVYSAYVRNAASPFAESRIEQDGDANRALQALIWDSQGALTSTPGQLGLGFGANAYAYLSARQRTLYETYWSYALTQGESDPRVHVLNLWGGTADGGAAAGSVLCLTVPAPGAVELGAWGMVAVGLLRRRR